MNALASIGNIGGMDMILLLLVVLILFGAKKLPELARGMGQAIREFNKAKDEFENEITRPVPPTAPQQAPHTLPHNPAASTIASAQPPPAAATAPAAQRVEVLKDERV